jgi:hypothetical protein
MLGAVARHVKAIAATPGVALILVATEELLAPSSKLLTEELPEERVHLGWHRL